MAGRPRTNAELESEIASLTAIEEHRRVEHALREADTRREETNVKRRIVEAILAERARCLAIAERWPDNLMARTIATKIREGAGA